MRNQKWVALLLCLCLVLPLCAGLGAHGAVATDAAPLPVTDAPEETPVPEQTPVPEETPEPEQTPEPDGTPTPETTTESGQTPEPDGTPAPEETPEPEAPGCTCGAAAEGPHAPDCPLYAPSAEALLEELLALEDAAALSAAILALPAEQYDLLENAQLELLRARLAALAGAAAEPAPDAPAAESEVIYPSRAYTRVAPFLPPVEGAAAALFRMALSGAGGDGEAGMVLDKTAIDNGDGTYTIRLEAFATGEQIITEVTEEIPTDIVLVLDQSGSMAESFTVVTGESFAAYDRATNEYYYQSNRRGNLWYPLDGAYVQVRVQREPVYGYEPFPADTTNSTYYLYGDALLERLGDGTYAPVDVTRSGSLMNRRYTYTFSDGTQAGPFSGASGVPDLGAHGPLYRQTRTDYRYTYAYTIDGVTTTLLAIDGEEADTGLTLYRRSVQTSSTTRVAALRGALDGFVAAVQEKAAGPDGEAGTADDVSHRIAVVGFASGTWYDGVNYNYGNTEILIGSRAYGYGASARSVYGTALQRMDTAAGQRNVAGAIDALDTNGGTLTHLGLEMANGILAANPVPGGEKRNRVVVVFTDGQPGWSGYDETVAAAAVSEAGRAKNDYGATVYTVGIYQGADPTDTAGDGDTQRSNRYMLDMSSGAGYFLSATNTAELDSIFERISDQVETGGASVTLGAEAVVRDVISRSFELPEGADAGQIRLSSAPCTAIDAQGNRTWGPETAAAGVTASVAGREVSVTGFDFAGQYVGTVTENGAATVRGSKLIIEFPVVPAQGFLGGNGVPTNDAAGVYETAAAAEPAFGFPEPVVDVPIPAVTVQAQERDVYLLGGLTEAQLWGGAAIRCGEAVLDPARADDPDAPYGLEPWQCAFVDIGLSSDRPGGLTALTADTDYTLTAAVAPKAEGKATAQTGSDGAPVRVFLPELTYCDSTIYLGETADYATENVPAAHVSWKHGGTAADERTMGAPPALTERFSPAAGALQADTDVTAAVSIGATDVTAYVTFVNEGDGHGNNGPGAHQFTVFVRGCTLTVQKRGSGSQTAGTESHIFTVSGPGGLCLRVAVQGNGSQTIVNLPAGTYTVTEEDGWSWRYEPGKGGTATLGRGQTAATVTIVNDAEDEQWLSGDACAVNRSPACTPDAGGAGQEAALVPKGRAAGSELAYDRGVSR